MVLATLGGIAVLILAYRAFLFLLKGRPNTHQYAELERLENPVHGSVVFEYELPQPGKVELKLLDSKSKELKSLFEGQMDEGKHTFSFDTTSIDDGDYNYKLITHNQSMVKKMVVRNKA